MMLRALSNAVGQVAVVAALALTAPRIGGSILRSGYFAPSFGWTRQQTQSRRAITMQLGQRVPIPIVQNWFPSTGPSSQRTP
jgi:hypothetical protein